MRNAILTAAAVCSFAALGAGPALADPPDRWERRDDRQEIRQDQRELNHDRAELRQDRRELNNDRRDDRRDDHRDDRRDDHRDVRHDWGPNRQYHDWRGNRGATFTLFFGSGYEPSYARDVNWYDQRFIPNGLSECQEAVYRGVRQRYGITRMRFAGNDWNGTVRWGRKTLRYRCMDDGINIW